MGDSNFVPGQTCSRWFYFVSSDFQVRGRFHPRSPLQESTSTSGSLPQASRWATTATAAGDADDRLVRLVGWLHSPLQVKYFLASPQWQKLDEGSIKIQGRAQSFQVLFLSKSFQKIFVSLRNCKLAANCDFFELLSKFNYRDSSLNSRLTQC